MSKANLPEEGTILPEDDPRVQVALRCFPFAWGGSISGAWDWRDASELVTNILRKHEEMTLGE